MTEVRDVSEKEGGGVGLFATRSYKTGDIILEEDNPFVKLAPKSQQQEKHLLQVVPPLKKKAKLKSDDNDDNDDDDEENQSFFSTIHPPSSISDEMKHIFKGMIQAVACFAEFEDESKLKDLSELYVPSDDPSEPEQPIVKLTKDALKFLQNHSKGSTKLRKLITEKPDVATKIMLIWTCNAFQGGRIYLKQSRINHSCDPNAVVQPDNDKQFVKAAADIEEGEEITISYLGLFLYADKNTRRKQLIANKHFVCMCSRCTTANDIAASIPCPRCHKRQGRYLDEDVMFDDDLTVKYCHPSPKQYGCDCCKQTLSVEEEVKAVENVSKKVITHLQKDIETDDDLIQEEWEGQLFELATSVAGARHWITNLISLMQLSRLLKAQHTTMLDTGANPSLEEIAEAIDSLERIVRFVDSLDLKLHMGHVLSNAVIGVARTLVSLGDQKSKQYANEWISKIEDYTANFESEGMQKVVEVLSNAHKDGDGHKKKKQRTK